MSQTQSDTVRLRNLLDSGEVIRFHAEPGVPSQTVGLHAWGVANLAAYIVPPEHLSPGLLIACLRHDAAERFTGDIPFTAKRGCFKGIRPILDDAEDEIMRSEIFPMPSLEDWEEIVLKLCDMLEGMRYAALYERPGGHVADRWFFVLHSYIVSPELTANLPSPIAERAFTVFQAVCPGHHRHRLEEDWASHQKLYGKNWEIENGTKTNP